jgi:hypothetical protein
MIEAAERANVKLMVAYRLHFEKGNLSATCRRTRSASRVFSAQISVNRLRRAIRA